VRDAGEQALHLQARIAAGRLPALDPRAPRRLVVGPLNTAGQADRWARAARTLPGTDARSVMVQRRGETTGPVLGYPADWRLSRRVQLRGMDTYAQRVLAATHVLAESGWAVLDDVYDRSIVQDLPALTGAGVRVGVVVHGSELRDLHRHAQTEQHSPFRGAWDERWHRLQATVERTRAVLAQVPGPVFVTTPDMLDHCPGAHLLPVVVDVDAFRTREPVLERARPVVLHAPTNPRLKGSPAIEAVLGDLAARGLIDYRRSDRVRHRDMPALLAQADVVVDQVVLGNPGVLAAEAWAAGRLVVAHLPESVRDRAPGIPVVEADPDTLGATMRGILADRSGYRDLARQGPVWARRHHDGRRAAAVLDEVLLSSGVGAG
jgi:hypothetical protein